MRKRFLWGMAIALLSFGTACEEVYVVKPEENIEESAPKAAQKTQITKYVILKGEHHSTLTYESTELEKLSFKALFDSSAIYQTTDPLNQGDINKLYGLSDCSTYHHTNSARFGWRWYENQLQIWAYTYNNGERKAAFVDTVSLDQFYTYEIGFEKNKYVFKLNNKIVEMPRLCENKAVGYKLFPYFGGDEAAPKDISIWVEELQD